MIKPRKFQAKIDPSSSEKTLTAEDVKELTPEEDPFLAAVLRLAKPRPDWPEDLALNHGHHINGEPVR